MTWTLLMVLERRGGVACCFSKRRRESLEDGAVAFDPAGVAQGRRASAVPAPGRRPRCRLRARRPAAVRSALRCSSLRTRGASSSSSATVSARHSTMNSSLTFQLRRQRGRVAQDDHAAVDQQAAVAVFGQAGERVEAAHLHAGPLEGFEQRVGEPLRQLVEGHPAVGQARAVHGARGASSRPAQRPGRPNPWGCRRARRCRRSPAVDCVGCGPDARQRTQQDQRQDVVRRDLGGRRQRRAVRDRPAHRTGRPAGRRRRRLRAVPPSLRPGGAAAWRGLDADQRVGLADLERVGPAGRPPGRAGRRRRPAAGARGSTRTGRW
jgi:hypothetical protein